VSAPTTFNLSQFYRAIGMRDPRVIPNVEGATLVPVISLGTFNSFAPEVIEARGFMNSGPHNLFAGQWLGISHQSTAPGGVVIEGLSGSDNTIWNLAPNKPFTGTPVAPFSMGGQPLISLFEQTVPVAGPPPLGGALGGTNTPVGVIGPNILADVWIPPSWFLWAILLGANAYSYAGWRFREVPEAQGPA
jgi:hypothetical protein